MTTFLYVAQGTLPAGEWGGSVGSLAAFAKQFPATVLVQLSAVTPEQVAALQKLGITVWCWDNFGQSAFQGLKGCTGLVAQIEGPSQRDAAAAVMKALPASVPRGVCTTYAGIDSADGSLWKAFLAAAGGRCDFVHVEVYAADGGPHASADAMLHQGVVWGIPANLLTPIFGVYRGELPTSYTWSNPSRNFEVWLGENLYDAQMAGNPQAAAWIAAWRTYWHVLSPAGVLLHSEWATTYPDGSTGLGKVLTWMTANADTIRTNGGAILTRVVALS